MKILSLVHILMPLAVIMAFLWAPPAKILGEASRIIYFHVPCAWVSTLAFFFSGAASIVYLSDRKRRFKHLEDRAFNSACIGMVFTVLTVITGSIWAKISWGSYWNWDPRETSIVILLLIYIAYFSLRSALMNNPNRARLASSYLIFAMATVPFLTFVIPRVYASLHPDPIINPQKQINLDAGMRATLLFTTVSFTLLYFYLLSMANRLTKIFYRVEEKYHDE